MLEKTETSVPIIHAPGDGRHVGVLQSGSTFKVESAQVGGAYALLEQRIPAGGGPPLHVHRHETEIFYILEGDFEITVGTQKIKAPPGACATCPRDIPHTFRNIGSTEGKLLLTIIPGRFGDYFIEVDRLDPTDKTALKTLAARYDVEFLE
jgi:mannose-6-phosphate isomerase-like protein (cupin superfamily)